MDPLTVAGALWTAILVLSLLGLCAPLVYAPVLLLQVIYKSLWLSASSWTLGQDISPPAIAVAPDGRFVLAAGRGPYLTLDLHLSSWNAAGEMLWEKAFGDPNDEKSQQSLQVALDPSGAALVAGSLSDSVDFGGGVLGDGQGTDRGFVVKFDAAGNFVWNTLFGGVGQARPTALAIAPDGDFVVSGSFDTILDFNGKIYSGDTTSAPFFARFGADGEPLWAQVSGKIDSFGQCVIADANAVIHLGTADSTIEFGGPPVDPSFLDMYVVKTTPDGTHISTRSFGNGSKQTNEAIGVDSLGHIFIAGEASGELTFGDVNVSTIGDDIVVAKLAP